MRRHRKPIVIASRSSALAKAQAAAVGAALARLHPRLEIQYRWIVSEGDQVPDTSLADLGGKGLFTKAVEKALLNYEADIAVHSLKDLPNADAPSDSPLTLAAIPTRADPRDCLISPTAKSLDELPQGAVLGTSSPRRAAQLLKLRPDLKIQPMRGNVETRLRKALEQNGCHATLLAVAGLERLDLRQHAAVPLDPSVVIPAAGQGALAIQCRANDHETIRRCLPLNDSISSAAVHAERRIVAALGGDCHSAIAVLAQPVGDPNVPQVRIHARVLGPDGRQCIEADQTTDQKHLGHLVKQISAQLIDAGAAQLLRHGTTGRD